MLYEVITMLGQSASDYRQQVYQHGFSDLVSVSCADVRDFLATCQSWLQQSITANLREDGLYNAYNIGLNYLTSEEPFWYTLADS